MKNKIVKLLGLAAVASSAVLGIRPEAQTNSEWGRMMWEKYGDDSGITITNNDWIINTNIYNLYAITNPMDGSLTDQNGKYIIPPQRIQLSAKISSELVTNWTTTSITSQVISKSQLNDLVYRPDILNQSGVIVSNTLATIQWHGKPVTVILETTQIGTANREVSR